MSLVRCEVKGVFVAMSGSTSIPLVLLSCGTERMLPIFIGLWEAVSINSAKYQEVLPRPFTHDLFLSLAEKFNITLTSLRIDTIEDGVYYAQLVFSRDGHEESLDCRPSDGIAIALRGNAPIFVEEQVIANAGQKFEDLTGVTDLATFLRK